jgi:hypothetical protein
MVFPVAHVTGYVWSAPSTENKKNRQRRFPQGRQFGVKNGKLPLLE